MPHSLVGMQNRTNFPSSPPGARPGPERRSLKAAGPGLDLEMPLNYCLLISQRRKLRSWKRTAYKPWLPLQKARGLLTAGRERSQNVAGHPATSTLGPPSRSRDTFLRALRTPRKAARRGALAWGPGLVRELQRQRRDMTAKSLLGHPGPCQEEPGFQEWGGDSPGSLRNVDFCHLAC